MKIIESFNTQFAKIVQLIKKARFNALHSVNQELIELYWQIGGYISDRVEKRRMG